MTIEKNTSLKEFTTFRIGGNAQFFCSVKNEDELVEAMKFVKENKIPFFILGGGSNILISDKGFKGLVIKMEMKGIEFLPDENGNVRVTAAAGEDWDAFVGKCVKKGLYGIETLSLIPGTVGAAPVQNIGAYGSEIKDTVDHVRVFDVTAGKFISVSNVDCHFQYRDSIFKKNPGKYIITSVTLILKTVAQPVTDYKDVKDYFSKKGIEKPTLAEVREAVIFIRTNKLPDVKLVGTAGSFFKNPFITHAKAHELKSLYPDMPLFPIDDKQIKVPLGWILDHVCDYKGISKGNVGTYKNQALVLVNNGNATAEEIKTFAQELIDVVKEKTGIDVEPEVQYVG
jgi:UDP-N-acetylmuramate dehydrogenase